MQASLVTFVPPPLPARKGKERILLVDDEPQMLVALEDLLSDDFLVTAVDQPARALRVLEQEPDIAVVLSDQRMPGMTGDELLRRLCSCSDATRLLVTGYADTSAVVRAVNEGRIFAYVTKPWDEDDLRQKVHHAADHFRLTKELAAERQLLSDLMTSMPDAIFFKDREQRFVRVNDGFLKLMGLSCAEDVLGKRLSEVLGDREEVRAMELEERRVMASGEARRDVQHQLSSRGSRRWLSTTRAAIRSHADGVVGVVGIARDVTTRVQTEQALRTSEERLRLAFSASNAGLFDWNVLTGEIVHSATASGITGSSPGQAAADFESLEERVHPEDRPLLRSAVTTHLEQRAPFTALELRARNDVGDYRWFEVSAQAAWDETGRPLRLVGSSVDVTARKESAAQLARLEFLAYYDDLTGLPNRALLSTRLERLTAARADEPRKFGLVLLDIGRFRQVNESLGRRGGDDLLREVAARLDESLKSDDSLARYEGNSFAALLSSVEDETDVALWLERTVFPKLSEVFFVQETELRVSVKAGIAMFPADGDGADAILANAEAALKKAKQRGEPYLFYAPSMNSRVAEKLTLETRLRRALLRDEFVLFYQPKVQLRTGSIVGVEALIRWQDPERGLIAPGSFIPVLEETQMILQVGQWVLERAAAQYCEWKAAGIDAPRIAVNVSALQLSQRDFVSTIDAVLAKHPAAAAGLDLELTESVIMDDLAGVIEKLRAAKQRGLHIAIDDFGTGYSSLSYLSRLPLDALKIDRSFVETMASDPQQMSIVSTIISLAHSLDLKVIAEGVETADQAQLLRLLRCDQIQGYLVARPCPADEVGPRLGHAVELPERLSTASVPLPKH